MKNGRWINNQLIWGIFLLMINSMLCGCAAQTQHIGTPIDTTKLNQIEKNKSTKSDIIALYGMPKTTLTPEMMKAGMTNYMPSYILADGNDEVIVYNYCEVNASGGGAGTVASAIGKGVASAVGVLVPFGSLASAAVPVKSKVSVANNCEHLYFMLNDDIVVNLTYIQKDPVVKENVDKILKGKTSKKELICIFGAPSQINETQKEKIYTYEDCILTTTSTSSAFNVSREEGKNCKNLTVVLDKNDSIVKTYAFQPYKVE